MSSLTCTYRSTLLQPTPTLPPANKKKMPESPEIYIIPYLPGHLIDPGPGAKAPDYTFRQVCEHDCRPCKIVTQVL